METRKFSRRTVVKIQGGFFIGSLILIGFILGRFTAPKQVEEVPQIETEPIIQETVSGEPKEVTVVIVPPAVEHENNLYSVPLPEAIQMYMFECCANDDVPADLVIAVIDKESDFVDDAISGTGDYGLMQINKCNHEWLEDMYGVTDFLNPYDNIYCGVKILSMYLERYGDVHKALMAYNMGESNAKALWDKGIVTSEYSREVVSIMEEYEHGSSNETR